MINTYTKRNSYDYIGGIRHISGKLKFKFRDETVGNYIVNVGIPSRYGIIMVTEIFRTGDGILLILNGEEIAIKFETVVETSYYSFYAKRILGIIRLYVW